MFQVFVNMFLILLINKLLTILPLFFFADIQIFGQAPPRWPNSQHCWCTEIDPESWPSEGVYFLCCWYWNHGNLVGSLKLSRKYVMEGMLSIESVLGFIFMLLALILDILKLILSPSLVKVCWGLFIVFLMDNQVSCMHWV